VVVAKKKSPSIDEASKASSKKWRRKDPKEEEEGEEEEGEGGEGEIEDGLACIIIYGIVVL
jgi:hypothetical protein